MDCKHLLLLPLMALSLLACDRASDDSGTTTATVISDTVSEAFMTTPGSSGRTVTGIAIDGAKRSIVLKQGTDTTVYDLPPRVDLEWEIGDTITLAIVTTSRGDSITSATRGTAPAPPDMAAK